MCMSFFKMAALWFWTMFNCNPPIAHCHPLLWGGGILVDHWSTISSSHWLHWQLSKWQLSVQPMTGLIINLARNGNNEILGCAKCHFWWKSQWKQRIWVILGCVISSIAPAKHGWLANTMWLILGLHPANERCHYKVTPSLIGWTQT